MAHCTTQLGLKEITGALKKTTEQGVHQITVTKKKHFHDPLTGEVCGTGPNEIFIQNRRDYDKHPLTAGETKQRGNWKQAFLELYHRWRAQLADPEPYKQFPAFVRVTLLNEQ